MSSISREIGIRTNGRRSIREPWYFCAIMGEPVPESETKIETLPTSKALGMRVCLRHADEPSHSDHEFWSRRRPRRDQYGG